MTKVTAKSNYLISIKNLEGARVNEEFHEEFSANYHRGNENGDYYLFDDTQVFLNYNKEMRIEDFSKNGENFKRVLQRIENNGFDLKELKK